MFVLKNIFKTLEIFNREYDLFVPKVKFVLMLKLK